jgi:hypothetical protein
VRLGVEYGVTTLRTKPFILVQSTRGLGAWFIDPIILREKNETLRAQRNRGL